MAATRRAITTRGILNPERGLARFDLAREAPPAALAPFVDRFWRVTWSLGDGEHEQEILPHPCVNLSFQDGRFEVHGPGTRRFVAKLTGSGRVFGTKFTPAGFAAFARVPATELADAVMTVERAIGAPLPLPPDDEPATLHAAIIAFRTSRAPVLTDAIALANRLVAAAQEDRAIRTAEDLAALGGIAVRSLHRLFARHVGVSPKWIVRRARVQEAADRVARAERVSWARVAQQLGYHDQAHLIRDFRRQIGFTPAAYARRCAAARSGSARR